VADATAFDVVTFEEDGLAPAAFLPRAQPA